jgi:hypothetical protein
MNLNKEQEKAERKEKIAGEVAKYTTQAFNMVGDYFGAQQAATDSANTKAADAVYD